MQLIKDIFGREQEQYNSFINTISEFFLCENMKNELVWKKTTSGEFLVKSFYQDYGEAGGTTQREWKWVWEGIALHKTKALI